jgi:hypothetical protein
MTMEGQRVAGRNGLDDVLLEFGIVFNDSETWIQLKCITSGSRRKIERASGQYRDLCFAVFQNAGSIRRPDCHDAFIATGGNASSRE